MEALDIGVVVIAPPLFDLVTSQDNRMVPTARARMLTDRGAGLTPWTLERSACGGELGPCGFYYQNVTSAYTYSDTLLMMYELVHTLKVNGVFSDYPFTLTTFLNCVPAYPGPISTPPPKAARAPSPSPLPPPSPSASPSSSLTNTPVSAAPPSPTSGTTTVVVAAVLVPVWVHPV